MAIAIAATLVAGCGIDATGPRDLSPTLRKQSTATESTVTIWDEYGTSYTLDPSALEIRVSTGVVIELYPEDLEPAATAFVAIHDGDALLTGTQNTPPPPPPPSECGQEKCPATGDMNVVVGGFSLNAPAALGINIGADPGAKGGFPKWNGKTYPTSIILKPSRQNTDRRAGLMGPGLSQSMVTGSDFSPYLALDGWNCSQIYGAIVGSFPEYLSSRLNVLSVVGTAAAASTTLEGGRPTVKRPSIPDLALQLIPAASAALTNKTAMAFMVTMYNSYGCQRIFAGGFNGGSLGGGLRLVCTQQTWIISFDAGKTWQDVKVSVCEFRLS
ncbi:MAG: hypothetical protein H7Z74_14030 [Anaerolineae bacterium]|nr:hypothetical protein [Gemmatimonadaceae bacterium]